MTQKLSLTLLGGRERRRWIEMINAVKKGRAVEDEDEEEFDLRVV